MTNEKYNIKDLLEMIQENVTYKDNKSEDSKNSSDEEENNSKKESLVSTISVPTNIDIDIRNNITGCPTITNYVPSETTIHKDNNCT